MRRRVAIAILIFLLILGGFAAIEWTFSTDDQNLQTQPFARFLHWLPSWFSVSGPLTPRRVRQIILAGNETTPDETIRKQIVMAPGDVLDYRKLRQISHSLGKLNLFRNLTVSVLDPDKSATYMDILITVEESRRGD